MGMNPVGSPLPAGTAPASGSAGAAQRASPSSPSNVAPSSSRPHAAGREEVSSSSLDRVLIHPLQPPGALSLILISSGMGAQPGLWESLRQRRPAWHPQGHSAEAKSMSRGPVAGGCGNSISGGGNCKGLKAGEAVSPKTVRKKQNPTPKNNKYKKQKCPLKLGAASGEGARAWPTRGWSPEPGFCSCIWAH